MTLVFSPVLAEPSNDDLRDLLLTGNVEAVVQTVEADRAINWSKDKLKINPLASEYYAIALIVLGDIDKAKYFIDKARDFHPKSQALRDCAKQLDFFAQHFINKDLKFTKQEKLHIKLYDLLHLYLAEEPQSKQATKLKQKILKEVEKLDGALPYFMTKLDYLSELNDPSLVDQISKQAFDTIAAKRKILFPKTLDFYELASAYKALARLSIQAGDKAKATQYIKLARSNIFKMKALWLEEDTRHYRKILKMEQRVTSFGYVLPQWLILLREEYDAYLN
ncbi:MAG: hypothetical protein OXU45_08840 [Candidatus Melainabacteria bacterium]|nr:hypothetical protein [Candidatus Melainabacteria bacterium]